MKLSCLQENLKQGLFVASHIAGKNVNLPILNNLMVEVREGKIRLVATNLEIGISSAVRGKIEKEGAFTVDSKIFSDYIGLLPNKKVDLEQSGNGLMVSCDNYKTKINGQSAEEFPLIPVLERKNSYLVGAEDFKGALTQVVFSAATSETRLELSGVLFIFNKNELILAATDSYRLAEKKIKIKNNRTAEDKAEKGIIVPVRTVQEIIRILSGAKEEEAREKNEIEIYVSENQILFVYGSTEMVSRLIEGQYPDYQQIIPTVSKTKATINRQELIRAVKASSLFSKTGINDINLDFPKNKKQAVVSSASGQTGENVVELEARVVGEDNGIVVNYRYLLDGLNNLEEEEAVIEVIDSNTPCLLRQAEGNDYLYIIMPIKQ